MNILVFFGPETPALYRPIADPDRCHVLYSHYACSPCVTAFNQRRTECTDNVCLEIDRRAVGSCDIATAIFEKKR